MSQGYRKPPPKNHVKFPWGKIKKILKHFEDHRSPLDLYLYNQCLSPHESMATTLSAVFIYSAQDADRDELLKLEDPDKFHFNKIIEKVANKRIFADRLNPPRKGLLKRVKKIFTRNR